MANPNLNSDKPQLNTVEAEFENNIRPREIDDFAGQPQLIENLIIFIKAAKLTRRGIGSYFVSWPSGFG